MSPNSGDDLFSRILAAFDEACSSRDEAVARQLLQIAATLHFGRVGLPRSQQEDGIRRLMFCHDGLWRLVIGLRNAGPEHLLDGPSNVWSLRHRLPPVAVRSDDPASAEEARMRGHG